MAEFLERQRTPENYWRAVILFGQNVASYKFALAKALIELSAHDNESVKLQELAELFSRHIVEHLAKAPKQTARASNQEHGGGSGGWSTCHQSISCKPSPQLDRRNPQHDPGTAGVCEGDSNAYGTAHRQAASVEELR